MEKEIARKLLEFQVRLNAPKDLTNNFGHYNYRSAESILMALKPLQKEIQCAINLNDEMVAIGDRVYVKATATITDCDSGQSYSVSAFAREEEAKKGMDGSQVTGATSSYARKYALNALFAIDDNKDADTNEFHYQTEEQKKKADEDARLAQEKVLNDLIAKVKSAKTTSELAEIWKGASLYHSNEQFKSAVADFGKKLRDAETAKAEPAEEKKAPAKKGGKK